MASSLKPIEKGKSFPPPRFATADIEASDWKDFICIGFYDINNDFYKWFDNLREYVVFAYDYCKENNIPNIFLHFGGKYDMNFLLGELAFMFETYTIGKIIPRASSILCFTQSMVSEDEEKSFQLTYRDSAALLPFSLRKMTKTFGVESQKGSVDFRFLRQAWNNEDYTPLLFDTQTMLSSGEFVKAYKILYDGKYVDNFKEISKSYDKEKVTYHEYNSDEIYKIDGKDEVLHYLKHDCKGLAESLFKFYEWPLIKAVGPAFTIAGQSLKIWRLFLKEELESLDEGHDKFVRSGYFGGRTEIFRTVFDSTYDVVNNPNNFPEEALNILKEQHGKKINYYDVNSLYPTVMQKYEYPNRCLGYVYGESEYKKDQLGFWEMEVFVPDMFCPPLPTTHVGQDGTTKLIFPTGLIHGVWSIYELEYAFSLGVRPVKFIKGLIFESAGFIFKEFIETLYKLRLEAKAKNDGVGDNNSKLVMNSTYGKTAQSRDKENLEFLDDFEGNVHDLHSEVSCGNKVVKLFKVKSYLEKTFSNVAIAAYVTSYARVHTHRELLLPSGDKLYYCDTDSAFTELEFESGKELGMVKLEYSCKSACFLLPKTYINQGFDDGSKKSKVTMKGFPKDKVAHFTYEDFVEFLRGELKELGIVQAPRFATLKTALKNGTFLHVMNDPKEARKADERKEAVINSAVEKYERDLERFKKNVSNDQAIKAFVDTYEVKRKKIVKDVYEYSKKAVKSRYTKRILYCYNFLTRPIKLGG